MVSVLKAHCLPQTKLTFLFCHLRACKTFVHTSCQLVTLLTLHAPKQHWETKKKKKVAAWQPSQANRLPPRPNCSTMPLSTVVRMLPWHKAALHSEPREPEVPAHRAVTAFGGGPQQGSPPRGAESNNRGNLEQQRTPNTDSMTTAKNYDMATH